ncbi:cell division protein FtsQ/DivIB [Pelagibacterales bacterium SAG-MED31]|nr:cell division protein FtsQ/DivIB [Pelagibacterales bacterium SAG-MED31]
MNTNFNKKKYIFISKPKKIKFFILSLILFIFLFLIYDDFKNKKRYQNFIQKFSENYNYQLESYEINTIIRTKKTLISEIIYKYLGQSIFLIPLNDISAEITNLKWVKAVNLTTNLKNIIKIEILEYEPVGLYLFNEQIYYFAKDGKIIDKVNRDLDEEYIIFSGKNSLKNADKLLEIISKLQYPELMKISEAHYIKDRRWNLKFYNQIKVYISEKNIDYSLINYIKLIKELNESEILSIKSIDLRNNKKAIINFK